MIRLSCWIGAKFGQSPSQSANARTAASRRETAPAWEVSAEAGRLAFPNAASMLLAHFLQEEESAQAKEVEDVSALAFPVQPIALRVFGALAQRLVSARRHPDCETPAC